MTTDTDADTLRAMPRSQRFQTLFSFDAFDYQHELIQAGDDGSCRNSSQFIHSPVVVPLLQLYTVQETVSPQFGHLFRCITPQRTQPLHIYSPD